MRGVNEPMPMDEFCRAEGDVCGCLNVDIHTGTRNGPVVCRGEELLCSIGRNA